MHPITAFNWINLMLQSSWIVQHSNASPFMRWIDLLVADFAIAHAAEDIFHAGHRVIHQLQSPADDETEIAMKHFVLILFDFVWFCLLVLVEWKCLPFRECARSSFSQTCWPVLLWGTSPAVWSWCPTKPTGNEFSFQCKKNKQQTNKQQQQQQRRTVSWIHLFRSTSLWRQ